MRDLEIVITDRSSASTILSSPVHRAQFAYVVSIGDPGELPPAGWRKGPNRLRLEFEDRLLASDGGPSKRDVERLIRFARGIDIGRGGILVHCQGGISRSTAAGAIILAVLLGPGREMDALRKVYRLRPQALPNGGMLELADVTLRRDGALMRAAVLVEAGRRTRDQADGAFGGMTRRTAPGDFGFTRAKSAL